MTTSKKAKSLFESKTFWLAVAQAVSSVVIVALTELDMVGYVGLVKSVVDVALRTSTDGPVHL